MAPSNPSPKMRVPQMRVLKILGEARGPLSKQEIASRIGCSFVSVVYAIGYSDKESREKFERDKSGGGTPANPNYSLLSLGMVEERTLDLDGIKETVIGLTPKGRNEYERIKNITLHKLKSLTSGE
jgi:hypothetical protein